MAPKPTLVLVTASFTPGTLYNNTKAALEVLGFPVHILQLPSVIPTGTPKPSKAPTMYDDAAFINSSVSALADSSGTDIVLIAHSYSGTPTSEGMKDLSKAARAKEGKKGGVVRVVYVTALVPRLGKGAGETNRTDEQEKSGESGMSDFVKIDVSAFDKFCFTIRKESGGDQKMLTKRCGRAITCPSSPLAIAKSRFPICRSTKH
jgi:hypothetical protein